MKDFIETVRETLALEPIDRPELLKPLDLAYMGDNVYEMLNRMIARSQGSRPVQKLHRECTGRASAVTQAKIADFLFDSLTEEEQKVYLRGRNAEVYTKAKNATIQEYHKATGLEAVIGYLFLKGEYERLCTLLQNGFTEIGCVWKKKD